MKVHSTTRNHFGLGLGLTVWVALLLSGCGGGGGGGGESTQSTAQPQTVTFSAAPGLAVNGTATVSATSSSGLPVTYASTTPAVCTVDSNSGVVRALTTGTCTVVANQPGDDRYSATQTTLDIAVTVGQVEQTITFSAAPTLSLRGTATVAATASSGLAITYASTTPSVCTVDGNTGVVTDIAIGTCVIAADQAGSATYTPAARVTQSISVIASRDQTITFGTVPTLTVGSTATIAATASSGLPVTFSTTTPATCSVNAESGMVSGIAAGNCAIAANQSGNADYDAAPQATLSITVAAAPTKTTAPGVPTGIKAELGAAGNTVVIAIGATESGGSPIVSYTATSNPAGLTGSGSGTSITVACPSTCTGYAFSVYATNAIGDGLPSAPIDVVTNYSVVETFMEPATQPNNSIFTGTFTLNSSKGTVSSLQGNLTESMTTDGSNPGCVSISGCSGGYGKVPMTLVPLTYQLSVVPATVDGTNGLFVTSFYLSSTNTFYAESASDDAWTPAAGVGVGGIYYGWPTALNPYKGGVGNAYAMIFINLTNPVTPLTQAQIDKLAYADCTKGGMMGAVCMTGTTVAGYGVVGTMGGYPASQVITKQ